MEFRLQCNKCGSPNIIIKSSTIASKSSKIRIEENTITKLPIVIQKPLDIDSSDILDYKLICRSCETVLHTSKTLKNLTSFILNKLTCRGASYGASTTHMSKLLPRIEGGSGAGCPLLVFGITRGLYKEDC
jgi:hypothetical protein